jgi:hypothetical protein
MYRSRFDLACERVGGSGDGNDAGQLRHIDSDVERGKTARGGKMYDARSAGAGDGVGSGDGYVERVFAEGASGGDAEALRIALPSGAGESDAGIAGERFTLQFGLESEK